MKNSSLSSFYSLFILVLTMICWSCGGSEEGPDVGGLPDSIELQGSLDDYQAMSIDFGLSMFQDVVATADENVLISPYSLQSALHMTMHGTAGETLEEFRVALGTRDFLADGLGTYYDELAVKLRPSAENTSFSSQNKVFYYPALFSPHTTYQEEVEAYYGATFSQEDFSDAATVDVINNWVDEATEGRIEKVIDQIQADEAIFLINALVFTADWSLGFEPNATKDSPFHKGDGTTISVPTMSSDDSRPFVVTEAYSAVDLPVKDEDYAVTFILPSADGDVQDFVSAFDTDRYKEINAQMQTSRVQVFLPKFELSTSKNLKDILVGRGMGTAFIDADLSGMGDFAGNPYLTRVLHDVFVKVDEKGIEGAAVTTVGVGVESVPPTIVFDRPFVFVIRHVETQVPIFIGKVGDPSA